MYRSELHMKARKWHQAISELSLAPTSTVPDFVRAAIHKNMGICYLRIGETDAAHEHLKSAMNYDKEHDFETEELVRLATQRPEDALDRKVDRSGVKEADRPMWEAFAEPTPGG
jgi:Tfp pilus assembly protein PilF